MRRHAPTGWVRAALAAALFAAACTYAPPEERATVQQIVRLGDSGRAVALIRRDVFRRPTGLSAFPDGGKWTYDERSASEFLLDVDARSAVALARQEAAREVWESFDAHVVGLEDDSAIYVRLTGCPRNGECYPALSNARLVRVSAAGDARRVDEVPAGADLPGTMFARAPGERRYLRFGTSGDTITLRDEEDGPYRPMFVLTPDGTLAAIDGRSADDGRR